MMANNLPLCNYETVAEAIDSIQAYHVADGPGTGEQFVGTLQMFIPLHDPEELRSLRQNWGSWNQMFKIIRHAKPNEGADSLAMADPRNEEEYIQFYGIPMGFLFQPIDEIRDYFVSINPISVSKVLLA